MTNHPCDHCGSAIRYEFTGGTRKMLCDDCAPTVGDRSRLRRYGVNKFMFDAMYFDQDGECAMASCTREAYSVDHDHRTGQVRGLLCQGCNIALGFLEDPDWFFSAIEYLEG